MIILHHNQQRTQKFQTKYHQRSTIMKWERESAGLTGCISALFLSSSILAGLRLRPKSLTMSEWRTVSDILLVKKDPKCNNVTLKMSANLSFVELRHTPRKTERVSNTYTFEKQWDINVTVALTQSRFRELRNRPKNTLATVMTKVKNKNDTQHHLSSTQQQPLISLKLFDSGIESSKFPSTFHPNCWLNNKMEEDL